MRVFPNLQIHNHRIVSSWGSDCSEVTSEDGSNVKNEFSHRPENPPHSWRQYVYVKEFFLVFLYILRNSSCLPHQNLLIFKLCLLIYRLLSDCVEYSVRPACHFTSLSSSCLLHLSLRLSSPPPCNLSVSCSTQADQSVEVFIFYSSAEELRELWGQEKVGLQICRAGDMGGGGLNVNCGTQSSLTKL